MTFNDFIGYCKANQKMLLAGAAGFVAALLMMLAFAYPRTTPSNATSTLAAQIASANSETTRRLTELADDVGRLRSQLGSDEQTVRESSEALGRLTEEAEREHAERKHFDSGFRAAHAVQHETDKNPAQIKALTDRTQQQEKNIRELESILSDPVKLQKRAAELQNALGRQ